MESYLSNFASNITPLGFSSFWKKKKDLLHRCSGSTAKWEKIYIYNNNKMCVLSLVSFSWEGEAANFFFFVDRFMVTDMLIKFIN